MGWLPFYATEKDIEFINDWLNQEAEIAFLVSNGPSKWIAKREHDILLDAKAQKEKLSLTWNFLNYELWHIPSGPLPLLGSGSSAMLRFKPEDWDEEPIPDPWSGWTELRAGRNATVPFFGSATGIIHLKIVLNDEGMIPISDFQWIGNHYKIIGSEADPVTEKFWQKLRRMARKVGTQIPRENEPNGRKEIFAFPAAYEAIQQGRPCSLN